MSPTSLCDLRESPRKLLSPILNANLAFVGRSIDEHLGWLAQRGLRPGTIDQRRRALHRLHQWLDPTHLLSASRADLEAFIARQIRSVASRAGEISHLRAFYQWAFDRDMIAADPTRQLVRPRLPRRLPRPMPDADFARALELAPDDIRPWLYLAGYGGLRCCEIAPLAGTDYLRTQRVLMLREMKGGDEGAIAVSPDLAEILDPLPTFGIWFPRLDGNPGSLTAASVSERANRFLHSIGIDSTIHSLRHWHGTQVLRATGNLRVTQEALRHKSPSSTAIYTLIEMDELAQAVAQLPRVI